MRVDATPGGSEPLWTEMGALPKGWRAGFTTRRAGGNLDGVLPLLGWTRHPIFRLRQRHGSRVLAIAGADIPDPHPEGDGLVTSRRGIVLAVASADCVPIVLFDPDREAGAVLHAGWRGTCSRIAQEGVRALAERFSSQPAKMIALIGPAIGACCYRVGADVEEAFRDAGHDLKGLWRQDGETAFLDLPGANRRQLMGAGLDPDRVRAVEQCTHCLPERFPSYRREGPGAGRILTFLGSDPSS